MATRTGLHCAPLVHKQLGTVARDGGVRFSIGAFNTEAEVDAAIAAIADIAKWSRERALRSDRLPRTSNISTEAVSAGGEAEETQSVQSARWSIEEILYSGDCEDSAGNKTLNARSYRVRLTKLAECLNIEVAVTYVASSYALDRLQRLAGTGIEDPDAVDADLVRCFVEEELEDEHWDPHRTPWLTIDSDDVSEIIARLVAQQIRGRSCSQASSLSLGELIRSLEWRNGSPQSFTTRSRGREFCTQNVPIMQAAVPASKQTGVLGFGLFVDGDVDVSKGLRLQIRHFGPVGSRIRTTSESA